MDVCILLWAVGYSPKRTTWLERHKWWLEHWGGFLGRLWSVKVSLKRDKFKIDRLKPQAYCAWEWEVMESREVRWKGGRQGRKQKGKSYFLALQFYLLRKLPYSCHQCKLHTFRWCILCLGFTQKMSQELNNLLPNNIMHVTRDYVEKEVQWQTS